MNLDVIIDDKTLRIDVPQDMLDDGEDFFQKMDRDMDHGWQMGPEFIENPNVENRCRIAANKLLISVSAQNRLMTQLMAAYILKRLPGIKTVNIDTGGEMLNTELVFEEGARHTVRSPRAQAPDLPPTESEARARAEQDVSQVYKIGKSFRFAVHDQSTGQWVESPFTATEEEALRLRDEACARLATRLMGN
jgi:hypothetical protein